MKALNLTTRHGGATIPLYGCFRPSDRLMEPVCRQRRALGLQRRQQDRLHRPTLTRPSGLICWPAWPLRPASSKSWFRCASAVLKSPSSPRRRPWLLRPIDSAWKVRKRATEGPLNRPPLGQLLGQQGMGQAATRLATVDAGQPLGQLHRAGGGPECVGQRSQFEPFFMPTMPAAGHQADAKHEVILQGAEDGHGAERTCFVPHRQQDDILTPSRGSAAPAARPKPSVA